MRPMARQPDPTARDRILDKAGELFYERGINAVGLQRVIDACGCGKNLLYREFASKDDLVVAYLEQSACESSAAMDAVVAEHADDPAAQLVAIVRDAVESARAPDYRGCPFHNAAAEFPDPDHPAHRAARQHLVAVRTRFRALARQVGADSPDELADRLMLLVEGVYASGVMLGGRGPMRAAVGLAEEMVRAATTPRAR